jgi:hypothetical protein
VTEVLVERGDGEVLRSVAGNKGARFSEGGFKSLINRARYDDLLAETIGVRQDLPEPHFLRLLQQASDLVCQKLSEAYPDRSLLINHVVDRIRGNIAPERDYSSAKRLVDNLKVNKELNEDTLFFFLSSNKYEESVVVLSVMTGTSIQIVEEVLASNSADPILILAKAAALSWNAAHALLTLQTRRPLSPHTVEGYRVSYLNLTTRTAQRVTRFYKVRQSVMGEQRAVSIFPDSDDREPEPAPGSRHDLTEPV